MAPGGGGLDSEALAGRSISDALRLMREQGLKKESLAGRTKDHRGEDAVPQWAEKVQCSLPPPPPPPSLPYKVDTSRPSLRTNWTRWTTAHACVLTYLYL